MNDEALVYYFKKYSLSLQKNSVERFGQFYHDGINRPVDYVYLCPLCLTNKAELIGNDLFYDEDFTHDHYPPLSAGGKRTIYVCRSCNEAAGKKFDNLVIKWLDEQSFIQGVPNSQIPVKLQLENTIGNYNGKLTQTGKSWMFDGFGKYPLVEKWFVDFFKKNRPAYQTITLNSTKTESIHKPLLKAAYLYCFDTWGYDFTFSETGSKLRKVIFEDEQHSLSNCGVYFHMKNKYPPDGLCYTYKPKSMQAFLINMRLSTKSNAFQCGVTIIIPGPSGADWDNLHHYESIIQNQKSFDVAMIKLPEDVLSNNNLTPYHDTWKTRTAFRIFGETE